MQYTAFVAASSVMQRCLIPSQIFWDKID